MKQTDASWLAGYLDGDGCICLEKNGKNNRRAKVVIDSADRELLEHVLAIVGAGFIVTKPKYADHHRQCWSYRLVGIGQVNKLLGAVLPYLRCEFKRQRAEMLVNEWENCTSRHYSPEQAAIKADFERRFLEIGEGRGKRAVSV